MPEGVARAQRWPHGALRAGRAAAFLTLATGVNGTLAAYVQSWDPRWLYIATVGLIAALDGWIVGLLAAAGAVVCYELMSFGAFRFVADRDSLLLAAAVIAAVAARAIRLAVARPTPPAQKAQPLLTGFTLPEETPGREAGFQEASATLRRSLEEERFRAERERAMRLDEESRARSLIDDLTAELRSAKGEIDQLTEQRAEYQSMVSAAETAARAAAERIADFERANEQLRVMLADSQRLRDASEARLIELESTLRTEQERAETTRVDLRNHVHDLEQENNRLTTEVTDLSSDRDAATRRAEESEHEREQLALKVAGLEVAREEAEARVIDLQWTQTRLKDQVAEAEASRERLARNAVEITDRFNAASMDADSRTDAARAEAAALAQRLELLERENADIRLQIENRTGASVDLQRRAEQLEAENAEIRAAAVELRARLEGQWQEKVEERDDAIDRLSTSLSVADHRARSTAETAESLNARVSELQRLNAELTERGEHATASHGDEEILRARIAQLEADMQQLHEARGEEQMRIQTEWSEKFARSAMEVSQRFQSELAVANDEAAQHREERDTLAERLAVLERENALIREAAAAERSKIDAEWNEKLQTIVEHLASDHEHDLGEATLEREEARAEARRLAKKLSHLESRGREIAVAFEELQRRNDVLRVELEERKRANEERPGRDAEWNARLAANAVELTQRFNGAMAAADARLQESRREAQNLASRVQELEDIIAALRVSDQERRSAIDAEWSEKLETIVTHLATDHESDIDQAMMEREEARAEARMYSSRVATLQKTLESDRATFEQAKTEWANDRDQLMRSIDVLRRRFDLGTYGGDIPLPPSAMQPVRANPAVLIVHRDSAVRAIAKQALDSSGYEVMTASDGLEAFRVALSQRPDVIIAESSMPKMDGRELVQMLKSRPETAAVKIILMADAQGETGKYSTSDFRADDFLRDPANVEVLKATLANVLGAKV
jgi:CheY-like chemotaxis protein